METSTLSHENALQKAVLKEEINDLYMRLQQLRAETKKIIVGQEHIIEGVIIALLCDGHILLEGVPGVAKTTIIKTITDILGLSFKRIQFTPDLLPADLIGTLIYNQKIADFETKKGPIFANLVLADEINRAPAKVQAALLEAMQERQVTIGNQTFILDKPFLVFATQNPIEHEGTYRLPEAQVDRFMFKLLVGYPTPAQEKEIIQRPAQKISLNQLYNQQEIIDAQQLVNKIYCDDLILEYIVRIIDATRQPEKYATPRNDMQKIKDYIAQGASPRATIALHQACRAKALLEKRTFVIPDDVKQWRYQFCVIVLLTTIEAMEARITPDSLVTRDTQYNPQRHNLDKILPIGEHSCYKLSYVGTRNRVHETSDYGLINASLVCIFIIT